MSKRLMILASALAFLMGVAIQVYSLPVGATSEWGIIMCLCRRDGKGCHYYIGHHGRGWDFVFTNVMAAIRLTAESNITAAAQTNLILKPETNSLKPELKLEEGL